MGWLHPERAMVAPQPNRSRRSEVEDE